MIQDSNKSGTYIEFSFEKSLRKYDKPLCKKSKSNLFANNQHSIPCSHCLEKLNRRDSIQSTDRKISYQSSRKNQLMRSRRKARQFSQTKRKVSNSGNKSRQSSIKKQSQNSWKKYQVSIVLPDPLSQFNVAEEMNLVHLKRQQILNLSLNKDVPKLQSYVMQSGKKKAKQNENENQSSIQQILRRNNFNESKMRRQKVGVRKNLYKFGFDSKDQNQKIIEQQDESFSQISMAQSNLVIYSRLLSNQQKEKREKNQPIQEDQEKNQEHQYQIAQNPVISYAYFPSCSSIHQFQSDNQESQLSQQNEFQQKSIQKIQPNSDQNPFFNLKLKSNESIKQQSLNEQKQKIFYKIKKTCQIQKSFKQCECISQEPKNQLINQVNQENQFNRIQTQNIEISNNLKQELPKLDQPTEIENEKKIKENGTKKTENLDIQHQIENPFKRAKPCQDLDKPISTPYKKRSRRINFEIDQDYQRLGRVRIPSVGNQNDSICLSVRRFNKERKNLCNQIGKMGYLDENKIINYLIAQRPYLQKNKSELTKLVSFILGQSNKNYNQMNEQKDTVNQ